MSFAKGETVLISGLTAKPELNGLEAIILGQQEGGRYPVELQSSEKARLRVKPDNLQRTTQLPIDKINLTPPDSPPAAPAPPTTTPPMKMLPSHVHASMKIIASTSLPFKEKLSTLRMLEAQTDHADMLAADFHVTLIELLARPRAVFSSDAAVAAEETSLRVAACTALQKLCTSDDAVNALLAAKVLPTLRALLRLKSAGKTKGSASENVRGAVAFHALDVIGTLANTRPGRVALAESSAVLTALVQVCNDGGAGDAQDWSPAIVSELRTSAMAALTACILERKCWVRLLPLLELHASCLLSCRLTEEPD